MPSGDELRAVMRRFPAGVAVLTVDDDGNRHGITIGSLTSLSLDPPLVGVSLGRDTITHGLVHHARSFAVSLLSAEQERLARHFARSVPPIAQWQGVEIRAGEVAPLLEGALGWIECRTWAEHDAGDHTIFIGAVERLELGRPGRGLVYREGGYHAA